MPFLRCDRDLVLIFFIPYILEIQSEVFFLVKLYDF